VRVGLGQNLVDGRGDCGRVGTGDAGGDLFGQLWLGPLWVLGLDSEQHVVDRRPYHRHRCRRVPQHHGEHLADIDESVGPSPPTSAHRRGRQPGIGRLRVTCCEGDRLVGLAHLDRSRWPPLTFEKRCRPRLDFCFDVDTTRRELHQHVSVGADDVSLTIAVDHTELDTQRCAQPGTKMRLILHSGGFGLAVEAAGVEGAPLTIRDCANCVGDQHMIMQLRIQRPAGAMPIPIPNPEHPLCVDHRSTGVTGSGVRDPR